jgi:predicted nuclease with RNAse H fold
VRLLGIDLAASPASTGVVSVSAAGDGRYRADAIDGGVDDDRLVEFARDADRIGVDAPLGWPDAFVEAVSAHHGFEPWTGGLDRSPLTHRETDRFTKQFTGRLPLSVSADLLGHVGMRCALLQRRWAIELWAGEPAPRDGSGRLSETYPAAAFAAWGIECRGYKARRREREAIDTRSRIVGELERDVRWLDLDDVRDRCVASDHVLDALMCALIAHAVAVGQTHRPAPDQVDVARREGWIHVPSEPLAELPAPGG